MHNRNVHLTLMTTTVDSEPEVEGRQEDLPHRAVSVIVVGLVELRWRRFLLLLLLLCPYDGDGDHPQQEQDRVERQANTASATLKNTK